MKTPKKTTSSALTRRDALKASGLALGGLVSGGGECYLPPEPGVECYLRPEEVGQCYPTHCNTQRYSYFDNLKTITPWGINYKGELTGTKLGANEMRITFLGSVIPPVRRAQQEMSVFVEVGWNDQENKPLDQFVFDCGSGVCANYGAMGISYGRMDKVFLSHLHADHMSDLSHIYTFGPSLDRKSPLYVWGPSKSNLIYTDSNDVSYGPYDDGLQTLCEMLHNPAVALGEFQLPNLGLLGLSYPSANPG